MNEFLHVLKDVRLFDGIERKDLSAMLSCLGARSVKVRKGDFILSAGDAVTHVGIVLEGRFCVVREDMDGERSLLAMVEPGEFFAEALCCAGVKESPVGVFADTDGTVLLLEFRRILHTCTNACAFHTRLIENMLSVLAVKNLQLQNRMELLGKKSIRARLMGYLESLSPPQGQEFSIPFNREELANFLCIDRSALSRELGRMKGDGLIDYWKNSFKIL